MGHPTAAPMSGVKRKRGAGKEPPAAAVEPPPPVQPTQGAAAAAAATSVAAASVRPGTHDKGKHFFFLLFTVFVFYL